MVSSIRINYAKKKIIKIGIVFAGLKYHLVVTTVSQNCFLVQNIILSFIDFFQYLNKSLFIFKPIVMNKPEFLFFIETIEHFLLKWRVFPRRKFAALQIHFSLSSFSVQNFQEFCGVKVCYLASIFVLCLKKCKKHTKNYRN